jgi:hypothetical protein
MFSLPFLLVRKNLLWALGRNTLDALYECGGGAAETSASSPLVVNFGGGGEVEVSHWAPSVTVQRMPVRSVAVQAGE